MGYSAEKYTDDSTIFMYGNCAYDLGIAQAAMAIEAGQIIEVDNDSFDFEEWEEIAGSTVSPENVAESDFDNAAEYLNYYYPNNNFKIMGYDYQKHDLISRARTILQNICGEEEYEVEETSNFDTSYTEVEQPQLTLVATGVTEAAFKASKGIAPQANFYIRFNIRYYSYGDYDSGYSGSIGVWLARPNKSEILKLTPSFSHSNILSLMDMLEDCVNRYSDTFSFHFLHN
jgi:hypothetical protein